MAAVLTTAVTGRGGSTAYAPRMAALPRPESMTVSAGNVALVARHLGGGRRIPVLLVHGLAANARTWDGVAVDLARAGHPVLAVDLRGHGASASVPDDPGSDPTLAAAADLAGVSSALGWTRLLLAGHSWGGNIALQLAADRPDLLAGLVLVDGGWLHLGDRFADIDAAWRTLAPPDLTGWDLANLREVLADAHPDWSDGALEAALANLEHRPDGTIRPWLTPDRHRARVASMLAHRPRELYGRIACRTVLLAAGDPPEAGADEAAASIPAATLTVFPGADHDLQLQYPTRVAAAISALG